MTEAFDFAKELRAVKDRSQNAFDYYERLKVTRQLNAVLLSEYRCTHGCLLLHAFQMPAGRAFFINGYRLSPAVNARSSNEAGRAANTRDGDRKWNPRAGMLDDAVNLTFNCDHVRQRVLEVEELEIGSPGNMTRRTLT